MRECYGYIVKECNGGYMVCRKSGCLLEFCDYLAEAKEYCRDRASMYGLGM